MKRKSIIAIAVPVALIAVAAVLFTVGTMKRTIPEGVYAVENFDSGNYLGKWYEIARLDYKWEKGLSHVTATYSMNEDGSIKVDNKGFDPSKQEWRSYIGKAKFTGAPDVAMLKVTFLEPFYSGYNVVAIDDGYRYAFVAGRNLDYMWLLSREKTMPEEITESYLRQASEAGYDVSNLVWTDQE